jgi:hypothetical protein
MCITITKEVVVNSLTLQSILEILHIFAHIGEQICYLPEFYKMDHEGRLVLMDSSITLNE